VRRQAVASERIGGGGLLRRAFLPVTFALALLVSSACREGETVLVEERYEVGGPIVLVVDVADASVDVHSGERTSVSVTAEFVDERYLFDSAATDGTVTVSLNRQGGLTGLGVRGEASLRLAIPRGSRVEIDSANGPVSVTVPIDGGRVRASNGRVEIAESEGELSVAASNGSLFIEEHSGPLVAETANGSITIREHFGGPVSAETSNGAVEYRGELAPGTANRLQTSNGRVTIELLGQPSVTLDAQATKGSVGSRYALLDVTRSEDSLRGRIGEGAATLEVRTSNGSIDLR
jgi:hypothetical protein